MRAVTLFCLTASASAALLSSERSSPLSKVVKMLEATLKDLKEERTLKENSFEKTSCLAKKTTEKNNDLIKENEASIDDMNNELSLLGSVTLTDEGQVLAKKIDAKKNDITSLVQELDDMTAAHNTHLADLDAGTASLIDAEAQIQGKQFLLQKVALRKALSKNSAVSLTFAQRSLLDNIMKQAPAEYESQVGAITELISNLKTQYQKESVAAKQTFRKSENAQNALIDEANGALSTLQQEFEAGEGEAAAKKKRSDELNVSISAAGKANIEAKKINSEMSTMLTKHTTEWQKYLDDSSAQEAAINKAIDILSDDEARTAFQTVEDNNSFLQVASFTKSKLRLKAGLSVGEGSAAIATLRSAIADMKSELEAEKDDIIMSVNSCEKTSLNLLENAKETAEQMDGFSANIASLEKKIISEKERQQKLSQSIADQLDEKETAITVFNGTIADLNRVKTDLIDAVAIVKSGTAALEEYDYQTNGKSDYHEAGKTNPLAGVISMLKTISSKMKSDIKATTTEITSTTDEHNDLMTKIGSATEVTEEDQYATEVLAPGSLIGDLEEERNASIDAMNDAQTRLNGDNVSLGNNQKSLSGPDGKGGILGAFKTMQPGCDYWMVNAASRKSEIADEIGGLLSADTILATQDLGLGSEDAMMMGSRQAGADAHRHEFEHVKM